MKKLLVIGGGLAGLSAAWHAQRAGAEVRVLESSDQSGGVVQTIRENGFLAETGPNTLIVANAEMARLLHHLGLANEIVESAPDARNRFVVRRGKLIALPTSIPQFLTTSFLSLRGKLRLLREPWAQTKSAEDAEESVADFARRRFGPEILDYGFEPFTAGVFAGDPEKLSARHAFPRLCALEAEHGSLLQAMVALKKQRRSFIPPRPVSFRDGMATLPRAFAAQLGDALSLNARLNSVERTTDGKWEASWEINGALNREEFDGVVIAVPALAVEKLPLPAEIRAQLAPLSKIEHPPVSVVVLGYARDAVKHPLNGFGALVPGVEPSEILGVLFTSSLFPGRAPAGHVTLTAFVGGARHPEFAALPDDALLALVSLNLEKILSVRGSPVYQRIIRWPRAIPQYGLDHGQTLAAIAATERAWPGLALAGSYYGGVSVTKCLETGRAAGLRALNLSPNAAG